MASDSGKPGGSYQPGYEVVAERLKRLIVESGLQPGSRLPTIEALSAQLGVGRKVVLEAVRLLSASHYVRVRRGSGVYVADNPPVAHTLVRLPPPADPREVENLFVFRTTLEEQSARLAAENATPRELRVIEEGVAQSRRGGEQGDGAEFNAGDSAFHLAVATATHNPYFVHCVEAALRIQREAIDKALMGVIPGSMARAGLEHQAIYEAIRCGNPDVAAEAVRQHIRLTLESYRAEVRRRIAGMESPGPS
jgi:GntR family transcriptional repressor for pyruvate dehydrogenase complex